MNASTMKRGRVMAAFGALTIAFVLTTVLTTATTAQAQRVFDDKTSDWWQLVEAQVTQSLNSPVEQIQVESLQHIVFFATYYPEHVDFRQAVGNMLYIFEHGGEDKIRTLALMALHATGDTYAMNRLRELVQNEPSLRIEKLTLAVLADYYGRTAI